MSTDYSDDPKLTFAQVKLQDLLDDLVSNPDLDFLDITKNRDQVLTRYQAIFEPSRIPKLTKSEFESFLLYQNNHHWNSLHRVQKHMTEDMELLREALGILLNERIPVKDRLNQLRPERYWGEHSMVSHLGIPVLTAILLVIYPEKYGVWNNTSDAGLKIVRLWNPRWEQESAGDVYIEMNKLYLQIRDYLNIDLWTLDALWWVIKKRAEEDKPNALRTELPKAQRPSKKILR